jgi:RimJ/RimL family protein N-acetyltransferase
MLLLSAGRFIETFFYNCVSKVMTNKIQIETERLLLREYDEADWEAVHNYAQKADILIYEAWGPNTETETKNFINTVLEDQAKQPRNSFDLAIILKAEEKLIGGCRFWFTNAEPCEGNIGYIINPGYWKNGYASEATNALTNYISTSYNIKIVNAACDVLNIASQRVLEKCGFELISTIEKHIEMKGRYRDTYIYERLI